MINCVVHSGPPRGRAGSRKPVSTITRSRCKRARVCARSFTQTHAELTVATQGQDGSQEEAGPRRLFPPFAGNAQTCTCVRVTQPSLEAGGVFPWGEQTHLRICVDSGAGGRARPEFDRIGVVPPHQVSEPKAVKLLSPRAPPAAPPVTFLGLPDLPSPVVSHSPHSCVQLSPHKVFVPLPTIKWPWRGLL